MDNDQNRKSTSVQYRHKFFPSIADSWMIKAADAGPEGSEGHLYFSSEVEVAAASGSRRLFKMLQTASPVSTASSMQSQDSGR